MARLRVVVAALLLLAIPTLARAQAGWYLTPSLSLSEEYQSNIFGTSSNEESDFVTRMAPGLILGYFSEPLTFSVSYSIDAEIFAENSELNNFGDNQRAGLIFRYLPDRRWTLGLTGSFVQSEDSGDLLVPPPASDTPARARPRPDADARAGRAAKPRAPPRASATPPAAPAGTVPVVPGVDVGRTRTTYVVVNPHGRLRVQPADHAGRRLHLHVDRRRERRPGPACHRADRRRLARAHPARSGPPAGTSRYLRPEESWHLPVGRGSRRLDAHAHRPDDALPRGRPPGQRRGRLGGRRHRPPRPPPQNASLFVSYVRTDQLVVGRSGASTTDTGSLGVSYYAHWESRVLRHPAT